MDPMTVEKAGSETLFEGFRVYFRWKINTRIIQISKPACSECIGCAEWSLKRDRLSHNTFVPRFINNILQIFVKFENQTSDCDPTNHIDFVSKLVRFGWFLSQIESQSADYSQKWSMRKRLRNFLNGAIFIFYQLFSLFEIRLVKSILSAEFVLNLSIL